MNGESLSKLKKLFEKSFYLRASWDEHVRVLSDEGRQSKIAIPIPARKGGFVIVARLGGDDRPSYLGCVWSCDDGAGRDLADGEWNDETWHHIVCDMAAWLFPHDSEAVPEVQKG
jgi:hypothetical protein